MHWIDLMGKIVSEIRVNVHNIGLIDFMLCFVYDINILIWQTISFIFLEF